MIESRILTVAPQFSLPSFTLLMVVLGTPACSPSSAGDGKPVSTEPTRVDSAGIMIITHHSPAWKTGEEWTIDSVPSFEIKEEEGSDIIEAWFVDGQKVAIVPADGYQLRVFDSTGKYLSTIGRRGSGPGEFNNLPSCGSDRESIMCWDAQNIRFTWFDLEGRVVAEKTVTESEPRSMLINGTMIWDRHFVKALGRDGAVLANRESPPPTKSGNFDRWEHLIMIRDSGTRVVQFGDIVTGHWNFKVHPDGSSGGTPMPFRDSRIIALGDDPYPLSVASWDGWELTQYGTDGKVSRIIRADIPNAPLSPEGRKMFGSLFPVPDSVGPIAYIQRDGTGNLWVYRRTHDGTARSDSAWKIDIVTPAGTWLGFVRFPPKLGGIMDIGVDRILTMVRDEMDVPTLRIYRIRKPKAHP